MDLVSAQVHHLLDSAIIMVDYNQWGVSSPGAQTQLMEAKRQLEQQAAQQQKTREQLKAAQLEVNGLRMQQGSSGGGLPLSSPCNMSFRGTHPAPAPTSQQGALLQRPGHRPSYLPSLILWTDTIAPLLRIKTVVLIQSHYKTVNVKPIEPKVSMFMSGNRMQ